MFPIKVRSDKAGFSLLDHISLIQASVERFMLNYCNKNPPDTPNTPIESLYMNPDLNALLTYKLTVERKAVFASFSFEIETRQRQRIIRRTFSEAVKNVDQARATEI